MQRVHFSSIYLLHFYSKIPSQCILRLYFSSSSFSCNHSGQDFLCTTPGKPHFLSPPMTLAVDYQAPFARPFQSIDLFGPAPYEALSSLGPLDATLTLQPFTKHFFTIILIHAIFLYLIYQTAS